MGMEKSEKIPESERTLIYDPKNEAEPVTNIAGKILRNPNASLIRIISFPRNCIENLGIIISNCINVEWLNLEGNLISELPSVHELKKCSKLRILNLHNNGI